MTYTVALTVVEWIFIFLVPTAGLAATLDSNTPDESRTQISSHLLSTEFVVVHPNPEKWESLTNEMYRNRGIAQITSLAKEYLLTISCEGIHQVFIHSTSQFDLSHFVGKFVQARYTYVEVKKRIQCIQKPCTPITQRKIIIRGLEETIGSEATRAQFEIQCEP